MKMFVLLGALACTLSLSAASPVFSPGKALQNKTPGQPVTEENGLFKVENTAAGTYSGMIFGLGGMTYQQDLRITFEYRCKLLEGSRKANYVGVVFYARNAGMSFQALPLNEKWQTVTLDFRDLKFHKKAVADGEILDKLHIYCRMPDTTPGRALLEVKNLRIAPQEAWSAKAAFRKQSKQAVCMEEDGVFSAENPTPSTTVPMVFGLHGMPLNPEMRLCFDYRSKVLSGGKERYIGVGFYTAKDSSFDSLPAAETWKKASISLNKLKFHKAGRMKPGTPLKHVIIYSRLKDGEPGKVRLEVKNVRLEKDPLYDAKAHIRLSYSGLPLVSWGQDGQDTIYIVKCSQNGRELFQKECRTPYFVPEKSLDPGIYQFNITMKSSGKQVFYEEVEVPALHHTWRMPEYDFAAFAAQHRPRLKKLALFFHPDPAGFAAGVKRSCNFQIPPNPEPYKKGADPKIRSWVEWYGKVADGVVSRTGSNLQSLGQAAVLSGDAELKNKAREKALIVARTWDPESGSSMSRGDLQAAHLLRGLVWCYDAAYDVMTPEERKTLADCIRVRGNQFWKSTFPFRSNEAQNHPWDRAEAAAFAAIGLAEEPGMAMRFDYVANLYAYRILACLGFKGENNEGLKYWSYGLGLAVRFVNAARYTVDLSLYGHPWLKQTARFPLYGMPARGYILSFGDNGQPNHNSLGPLNRPFTALLAGEAGDAEALWYAGYPERNGVTAKPPVDIPQSMDYEHLGIAAFNTFLADGRENVALAFHSGKYFAGHQHPDNNSFIINAYGDKLAIDGGYYDWYGSRHFKAYSFTTEAHNTVLVNGKGQTPRVTGGDGKMTGYFDSPNFGFVSGDASNPKLYMGELKKFDRDVLFLKPDFVAVYDRLAADKPAKFQWLLHSHSAKPIDYKDGSFRFERPLAAMSGVMLLPEKFTGKVGPSYKVGPVLGYSETLDPNPEPEWTLTVENAAPAKETEFFSVMQISRTGEKRDVKWQKMTSANAVAAVSKAAAVIFRRTASGIAEAGPFKTDAKAAGVVFNADGSIYDAMMKDGTYLEYNGKKLLKGKGSLAQKTTPDVEVKKVPVKFGKQVCQADYRILRMAFGREVHMVSGLTDLSDAAQSWRLASGRYEAPVSLLLMQGTRYLAGNIGESASYALGKGKLAFSMTSAKPFTVPDFESLGEMKLLNGETMPALWQLPADAVKIEAENLLSENAPKAITTERASASGGKASIAWNDSGKRGSWKITVPADGKYKLAICYATSNARAARELSLDREFLAPGVMGVVLSGTGGFGYTPAEWLWSICPQVLDLKAGEHELGMTVMYGSANLDALALIPVK